MQVGPQFANFPQLQLGLSQSFPVPEVTSDLHLPFEDFPPSCTWMACKLRPVLYLRPVLLGLQGPKHQVQSKP